MENVNLETEMSFEESGKLALAQLAAKITAEEEKAKITAEEEKAFDAVSAWLSGAVKAEHGFIMAAFFAFDQFNKGNRNPLAKLLTVVNGKTAKRINRKEGDKLVFATPLKRLCQHILPNTTAKYNPMSDFGVAWATAKDANNTFDADSFNRLATLAQIGVKELDRVVLSPFGKTFKEYFPAIVNKKEKDEAAKYAAEADAVLRWAKKEGLSVSILIHTLEEKAKKAEA